MTIEKNLFVLCENIVIGNGGKISLINLYEIIYAENVPVFHGKLSFALNIKLQEVKKTDKSVTLKLDINSPSGKSMLPTPLIVERPVNGDMAKQNIGFALDVNNVGFTEFGTYVVTATLNDKDKFLFEFQVMRSPAKTSNSNH